jgi:hypothetical protein
MEEAGEAAEVEAPQARSEGSVSRPAFIYLLEGPSGAYVGCSVNVPARRASHWSRARSLKAPWAQPVHYAMSRDGLDAWTLRIVACARDERGGRDTEQRLIAQLQREGLRVFNADPCEAAARGHADRHARFAAANPSLVSP